MDKLTGKIIFTGDIITTSPIIIGTGKGELVDSEIMKGYDKNIPYIPASSFIGALRNYFYSEADLKDINKTQLDYFWGSENTNGKFFQSHFIIDDLILKNEPLITVRDGIKINNKGIAESGKKYEYEILEPGAEFSLYGEITIRDGFYKNLFLQVIKTIIEDLKNEKIYIGALTTKGFGRIKLKDEKIYQFNFPEDTNKWLEFRKSENWQTIEQKNQINKNWEEIKPLNKKSKKDIIIEATFSLKNSLIIGSYTGDSDKSHLKSKGSPILSGTSIKGTIRNRAVKIIKTLGGDEKFLDELFGWAEEKSDKEPIKSKVIFEESIIENVEEKEQKRIKIDRFTGGVIQHLLFESKPIWHKDERIKIRIKITDYCNWEVGLILLVLKDLWNEDLPIGGEKNIGRGVLRGIEAEINAGDKKITIRQEGENLEVSNEDKEELENYVNAFLKKIGVKNGQ
ncbi:MAG TPA: RAMP superfamily CRISPR-associated protein [bacterium]|nr:RAMP superfamily CRISPR-associated protein [bacterium]